MSEPLDQLHFRFVEEAGLTTQALGYGRTLGQIFGELYLSPDPLTLDQLTERLEVSKGGASMAVRKLEQWGAVRKVWVKGDRKDYLEARDEFGVIVRKALLDTAAERMRHVGALLKEAEQLLEKKNDQVHDDPKRIAFYRKQIRTLTVFRDRARWIWDRSLVRLIMKREAKIS